MTTQAGVPENRQPADDDEQMLHKLGYAQELFRAMGGFQNFAISFTIISILAGCFTTYGQAWSNGGPIAISWGWPIICALIMFVAFSMAEHVRGTEHVLAGLLPPS